MNWVGGTRSRIRKQDEKKKQKEFFAKMKQARKSQSEEEMQDSAKSFLSKDLLFFQTVDKFFQPKITKSQTPSADVPINPTISESQKRNEESQTRNYGNHSENKIAPSIPTVDLSNLKHTRKQAEVTCGNRLFETNRERLASTLQDVSNIQVPLFQPTALCDFSFKELDMTVYTVNRNWYYPRSSTNLLVFIQDFKGDVRTFSTLSIELLRFFPEFIRRKSCNKSCNSSWIRAWTYCVSALFNSCDGTYYKPQYVTISTPEETTSCCSPSTYLMDKSSEPMYVPSGLPLKNARTSSSVSALQCKEKLDTNIFNQESLLFSGLADLDMSKIEGGSEISATSSTSCTEMKQFKPSSEKLKHNENLHCSIDYIDCDAYEESKVPSYTKRNSFHHPLIWSTPLKPGWLKAIGSETPRNFSGKQPSRNKTYLESSRGLFSWGKIKEPSLASSKPSALALLSHKPEGPTTSSESDAPSRVSKWEYFMEERTESCEIYFGGVEEFLEMSTAVDIGSVEPCSNNEQHVGLSSGDSFVLKEGVEEYLEVFTEVDIRTVEPCSNGKQHTGLSSGDTSVLQEVLDLESKETWQDASDYQKWLIKEICQQLLYIHSENGGECMHKSVAQQKAAAGESLVQDVCSIGKSCIPKVVEVCDQGTKMERTEYKDQSLGTENILKLDFGVQSSACLEDKSMQTENNGVTNTPSKKVSLKKQQSLTKNVKKSKVSDTQEISLKTDSGRQTDSNTGIYLTHLSF